MTFKFQFVKVFLRAFAPLRLSVNFFMAFALSCVSLQAAFAEENSPTSAVPVADAVVARVNGQSLLLSQIQEAAFDLQVPVSSLTSEGLKGDGYRKAITALVDEELLVQAARKAEIPTDETELARRVDDMMTRLMNRMGGEEAFKKFLQRSHLSRDALRRTVTDREKRRDLSAEIVARRVAINSAEVDEFRRKRDEAGEPSEESLVAQILILCPKAEQDSAAGRKLFEKALAASRDAGKDKTLFADVARKMSDDAGTRERGGMLGWVDPKSLREPLSNHLKGMEIGDVSEPLSSDIGYHVLYLLDRHDARDLLFSQRFGEERSKLLESLRRDASIEIYPLE